MKTIDGGLSWSNLVSEPINIFSVHFSNELRGWAVGPNGLILNTTDGGTDWVTQTSGTTYYLNSIYFTDNQTGWIVGNNGTILRTTNGGVTFIEDEENSFTQPTEFLLQQNYPNPFNPSTTISYQLPKADFVTLRVYDILGKEIATLVNEEKPAGIYNVQFTINNLQLSSGIYFYRLQADDFVETKKMILLK